MGFAIAPTLNDVATLFGVLFGITGLGLSIINYRRDNPIIVVELLWDMTVANNPKYPPTKKWGIVRVTNTGRRPIYISHAALKLPKGYGDTHFMLQEGIPGICLAEGDPPKTYMVDQSGLSKYAKDWHKISAQVSDSAGKTWQSNYQKKSQKPSWAK